VSKNIIEIDNIDMVHENVLMLHISLFDKIAHNRVVKTK